MSMKIFNDTIGNRNRSPMPVNTSFRRTRPWVHLAPPINTNSFLYMHTEKCTIVKHVLTLTVTVDISGSWFEMPHIRRHIGSLWRRMERIKSRGRSKKLTWEFESRTKWRGGHKSYVSCDVVCKILPNSLLPLDWGWRHLFLYTVYCEYI